MRTRRRRTSTWRDTLTMLLAPLLLAWFWLTDDGGGSGDGGEGGEGGTGDGGDGGSGSGDGGDTKTFDQDAVNKFTANARKDGAKSAKKEIAEQLGVSVDEATKIVEAHRKAEKDAMSEAERAKVEAAEAKAAADADRAAAARDRRMAQIERALPLSGAALAMAAGQVDAALDDGDISDDALTEAVAKLREDVPGLFSDDKGNPTPSPAPSSSTGGKPPAKPSGKTAKERAQERIAAMGIEAEEPSTDDRIRMIGGDAA